MINIYTAFTIDGAQIDEVMKSHPWGLTQDEAGEAVRDALGSALQAVVEKIPPSRYRSLAIDAIILSRLYANTAITFKGEL